MKYPDLPPRATGRPRGFGRWRKTNTPTLEHHGRLRVREVVRSPGRRTAVL